MYDQLNIYFVVNWTPEEDAKLLAVVQTLGFADNGVEKDCKCVSSMFCCYTASHVHVVLSLLLREQDLSVHDRAEAHQQAVSRAVAEPCKPRCHPCGMER